MSVALATGWLLTTANTGDSACVLDTGCSMLEMTSDHRIHSWWGNGLRGMLAAPARAVSWMAVLAWLAHDLECGPSLTSPPS